MYFAATARNCCKWRALLVSCGAVFALATGTALGHAPVEDQISSLSERIANDSEDARLYLKRGELHRVNRDWAAALDDFRRSRRLDPESAAADLAIARTRLESGKPRRALAALDRALSRAPDDPRTLLLRGRALAALGESLAASADFSRAIELERRAGARPEPDAYLERARALTAAGPAFLDEALRGLEEGLELLGRPVTLELEALEIESASGRTADALARLDRLASGSPRPAPWLARRGEVLERAGRAGDAAREYARALEIYASLPEPRRRLAAIARAEADLRARLARLAHPVDGGASR